MPFLNTPNNAVGVEMKVRTGFITFRPSLVERSAFDAAAGNQRLGRRRVERFASAEGVDEGGGCVLGLPRGLAHASAGVVGQSVLELGEHILCPVGQLPEGVAGMEQILDVPAQHSGRMENLARDVLDDERRQSAEGQEFHDGVLRQGGDRVANAVAHEVVDGPHNDRHPDNDARTSLRFKSWPTKNIQSYLHCETGIIIGIYFYRYKESEAWRVQTCF